jgi:hypothetical protein
MTKNDIDINNLVVMDYTAPESVFDKKRTKTSHFMLNAVFPNSSLMATEYFVNAFLDDVQFKHNIIRPIFLVFKTRGNADTKWNAIASRLRAKSEYVLEYFAGTQAGRNIVVMVFQIPDKFAKDYLYFKAGKYSHFSDAYKKLFSRYSHNDRAQPVESNIWRVIHRSPELKKELEKYFNLEATGKIGKPVEFGKDDELWGIPEPKYEYFRYEPQNEQ